MLHTRSSPSTDFMYQSSSFTEQLWVPSSFLSRCSGVVLGEKSMGLKSPSATLMEISGASASTMVSHSSDLKRAVRVLLHPHILL